MKKQMKWGLATLLLLLGIAAVFIFLDQNAELRQLEKETAESDKLFEESKKQKKIEEANLPADDVKKPPPGETHETGYWHGDHWYKIVADELMVPPKDTEQHTTQKATDWKALSLEERRKRWTEAYRAKWGDDPPWNAEYRHVHDSKGKVRRHYRNKPLVTDYEIRINFAPTPVILERYLTLKTSYHNAESAGDFPKATSILEEMQKIVDNNQAELPKRPFGIAYYGKSVSPEVERQLNDDAVKELYTFMGVTHLYEFYEK